MADLRTRYLGMELRSPLVASSSPLTGTLDGLRRLEAAGAGAVVLPYFSSLTNLAGQLVEAGADGLVLFNRFYQPDLDIEAMAVRPALTLSSSTELGLPLRWIAILHRRHRVSLAASSGVHTASDVLKVVLAGADVAMMTSALLRYGPDHLRPLEVQVRDWMDGHGVQTVDQLRGRLSQRSVPDPAAFERANYIKTLASHPASGRVLPEVPSDGTGTRSG
jgi:dihydroorotate dehydrogenase (fumarate)